MLRLDHLVVAALDLDDGASYVENALGVNLQSGGTHKLMATHNKLLRLDRGAYLEVIAPDPNGIHQRPRWFSLDEPGMKETLAREPWLITWVVNTGDITAAVRRLALSTMQVLEVSRGELSWKIAVPENGVMAFDGAMPTLIEWPPGVHPFERLQDKACVLRKLTVAHPEGRSLAALLQPVLNDTRISFETSDKPAISAQIDTPSGRHILR
jgi:hypothetical protein